MNSQVHSIPFSEHASIEAAPAHIETTIKNKSGIVFGLKMKFAETRIRFAILKIAIKNYRSPLLWIKITRALENNRLKYLGAGTLRKLAKVDGRYYWDLYAPGFPSQAFTNYFEGEMNRISPINKKTNRFINAFVAITKKCPLQCEHCFEWDILNQKENLTLSDLHALVKRFQETGVAQIQFSGGEPMMRLKDMLQVIEAGSKDVDFWVVTSGYKLNLENAKLLKAAGLRGVVISLDHYNKDAHNKFRGTESSFDWVLTAVKAAHEAGLVTTLSVCVTKSFANENNLLQYATLAKDLGVAFIQLLEPKPAGRYKNQDVKLSITQELVLEKMNLKLSYEKAFENYPLMSYHGHYQRKTGCFGAGSRHLYTNTDGQIQACPFCQLTLGSALGNEFHQIISSMDGVACDTYKKAEF